MTIAVVFIYPNQYYPSKMKKGNTSVIVIGGGPAGLMAAGQAALRGYHVMLMEKMDSPASKLRLTGNGRCNITNLGSIDDFEKAFGRNGKFLRTAFAKFFNTDLIKFIHHVGVRTIDDDRGRVYPASGFADEVAEKLIGWVRDSGVIFKYPAEAAGIIVVKNQVRGVELKRSRKVFETEIVIVATGGASYQSTGSTGDGYRLAEACGHKIVPIRPSLVPLMVSESYVSDLKGIGVNQVRASVIVDGKTLITRDGDTLFTHFGLSGPLILSLSKICVDKLRVGEKPILTLDLLPRITTEEFDKSLREKFAAYGKRQIASIVNEYLPHRLIEVVLAENGIDPEKQCGQITASERQTILSALKNLTFEIRGHRSFEQAMVTAGGVDLKEINPQSMESKLVRGLYFAGEVLDLDGDTGGYNLQAAFSTGYLAGRTCAP
jgi:predicted Rossmann fold flavoprotein